VRTHSTCALGSGPALGRKPPGPAKRTKEPINQAAACSSSVARSGLAFRMRSSAMRRARFSTPRKLRGRLTTTSSSSTPRRARFAQPAAANSPMRRTRACCPSTIASCCSKGRWRRDHQLDHPHLHQSLDRRAHLATLRPAPVQRGSELRDRARRLEQLTEVQAVGRLQPQPRCPFGPGQVEGLATCLGPRGDDDFAVVEARLPAGWRQLEALRAAPLVPGRSRLVVGQ
jgi:hypothetical protein